MPHKYRRHYDKNMGYNIADENRTARPQSSSLSSFVCVMLSSYFVSHFMLGSPICRRIMRAILCRSPSTRTRSTTTAAIGSTMRREMAADRRQAVSSRTVARKIWKHRSYRARTRTRRPMAHRSRSRTLPMRTVSNATADGEVVDI